MEQKVVLMSKYYKKQLIVCIVWKIGEKCKNVILKNAEDAEQTQ